MNRQQKPKLHNTDSEQTIIATMIAAPEVMNGVFEKLESSDFYDPNCEAIYRALTDFTDEKKEIDTTLLSEKSGITVEVVDSIFIKYVSISRLKEHIQIVKEYAFRRELVNVLKRQREKMMSGESLNAIHAVEDIFTRIKAYYLEGERPDMIEEVVGILKDLYQRSNKAHTLTTGFKHLDYYITINPCDLVIIAARPSIGKTALAVNMAYNMANSGVSALFFSCEMSATMLAIRQLSGESKVPLREVLRGEMSADQYGRLLLKLAYLKSSTVQFKDKDSMNIFYICNKIEQAVKRDGVQIAFIDYLQLIRHPSRMPVYERITDISARLKQCAKKTGIPIVALCQIHRSADKRKNKRPTLSELKGSGDLEQDADTVMLLHRENFYDKKHSNDAGICEIHIAKQRNGETGLVRLWYLPRFTKFEDYQEEV